MQHSYIVLYYMPNLAFTLIFNILDIEAHYDCYVFTVRRVYSGQIFYIYHTVSYRIHAWTLRKYRCGFMHTHSIYVHKYNPVQFCKLLQQNSERLNKCWWCVWRKGQLRTVADGNGQLRTLLWKSAENNCRIICAERENVVTLHQFQKGAQAWRSRET